MPATAPAQKPTPLELYRSRVRGGALDPDPAQEQAAAALDRLYHDLCHPERQRRISKGFFAALRMTKPQPVKGVYLWGGVGRGKSMLMDLFFGCLPEDMPKRRIHFHEFMIEVHNFLHKARQDSKSEAAILHCAKDIAAKTTVLCFDEFHVTDVADAMILGRLFTALFGHEVTVVATSNWPQDRLYEGGLQRELFLPFITLMKERLEIVEVGGGTDYRLQSLRESGVYFAPLGAVARQQADEAFHRLVNGAEIYSETLSVKGRAIQAPVVARGVARFAFADLCEKPLGAEDYLMIAHNYHTVFLEGVPKLKYDRRNEAKRLMTLVDALYDTRTKLVITADAPPEDLYQGKDHAFEFQRTVSRLIEMQGEGYLKDDHSPVTAT